MKRTQKPWAAAARVDVAHSICDIFKIAGFTSGTGITLSCTPIFPVCIHCKTKQNPWKSNKEWPWKSAAVLEYRNPFSDCSQTLPNLQSWEVSQAQVHLTHWLADASIHPLIHPCIHQPTHHSSEPHLCLCRIPRRPEIPSSSFLPSGCNIFTFALLWLITMIHAVNLLHLLHL